MTKTSDADSDRLFQVYNEFHHVCDTARFRKLFARVKLIRMVRDLPGDIFDAGAFKGISTLQFAHLLETYQPLSRSKVVSFDTFDTTMPGARPDELQNVANLMKDFDPTAYAVLLETITHQKLDHRVTLVRGDITETLPKYLSDNPGCRISLLHCDIDIYAPTLATLKLLGHALCPAASSYSMNMPSRIGGRQMLRTSSSVLSPTRHN